MEIMEVADREWECKRIESGLSSGEGLIYAVRDKLERMKDGQLTEIDPGVTDERLLVFEGEFGQAKQRLRPRRPRHLRPGGSSTCTNCCITAPCPRSCRIHPIDRRLASPSTQTAPTLPSSTGSSND
jgi:hypothetical protein